MALLDEENGKNRRAGYRGMIPEYASMPRGGRVIIDPAKLRYWRHARLMKQADLARLARVSLSSVESYETGRRYPREAAFRRLVTALGVPPEDLLFDDCRYVRKKKED